MREPLVRGAVHPASFRDPSGFVFTRDGVVYRQVNDRFADEFDALVDSGLYDELVARGLLVAHEEVGLDQAARPQTAHRVLRPDPVEFVSYPYEWCPAQLREAALTTLEIQDLALDHDMTLKDASAYNIQFVEGRAVLIDSLSFDPLVAGQPWVAYGQFCSHFLAPLALAVHVDVRLSSLLRHHIDGIPLDLASRLLPLRTRLRPSLLTHLHLHGRMQRRHEHDNQNQGDAGPGDRRFSVRAFRGLIDSLRGATDKLVWEAPDSTWSDYYDQADHYPTATMEAKEHLVDEWLERLDPRVVWDLGANTGRFSRIATRHADQVVAFDVDPATVQAAWQHRDDPSHGPGHLLPLVMDLTNPSPGLGWAHAERDALADRGRADVTLALALIHHLAIGGNVPLGRIVDFLRAITRDAVVEFVPGDDPRARGLMTGRQEVFSGYTRQAFEAAVSRHFTISRREALDGTDRDLYLLRGPQ